MAFVRASVTALPRGAPCRRSSTGAIEFVIQSVEHPDGTFTASQIISGTHGTAVGQDGSRYAFNYQNNAHVADKTEALRCFTFTGIDKFNLVGAGSAPDIHVMQRFTIRINEDQSTTLLKFEVRGDPSCDPI